jgi:hypothetical protein
MLVDYSSIFEIVSSLFGKTEFGSHKARLKSLAELLRGMIFLSLAGLSGMARGNAILNPDKTFEGQLKRAFRLLNAPSLDSWALGKSLYDRLTDGRSEVIIGVDWTQVGRFMVLEAGLLIEGRAVPFFCLSVLKSDLKGRQRVLEMSMEYALTAMANEGQTLFVAVDRGFAAMDYLGPSSLYPRYHRITRLKNNMILQWDDIIAPFREWPLYEGEAVTIQKAVIGRKKQVVCGVCLANIGGECYLACDPKDVDRALDFYEKRVWIEEQNRDLKTCFRVKVLRFHRAVRLERMWGILGIAFAIAYSAAKKGHDCVSRLSRSYKDGRKDLSWLSSALYF